MKGFWIVVLGIIVLGLAQRNQELVETRRDPIPSRSISSDVEEEVEEENDVIKESLQLTEAEGNELWKHLFVAPVPTPAAADHFKEVVSKREFERMFPKRNPFYTYKSLAAAAGTVREFAGVGPMSLRKREAAAFLANASQETAGLKYIRELYCKEGGEGYEYENCNYCDVDKRDTTICVSGRRYYGRGPGLLAGALEYRRASFEIFGDARLSRDPGMVARDPVVAWRTALWRWMSRPSQGPFVGLSQESAHDSITSVSAMNTGFAGTIAAVTRGWECRPIYTKEGKAKHPGMERRVQYFFSFVEILGTKPAGPNECYRS